MSTIFELFGYRRDAWNAEAQANLEKARCPFMDAECDGGGNRQQSALHLTEHPELAVHFPGKTKVQAGVCSLLVNDARQPWIVCPRRLLTMRSNNTAHQQFVREKLLRHVELPAGQYRVWSEAKMKIETSNNEAEDKYFDYTFDYIIAGSCRKKVSEISTIVGLSVRDTRRTAEANGFILAQRDGELWVDNFPSDPVVIVEIMTSSTSGGNKRNRTQIAMAFEDAVLHGQHAGPGINYRQVWARMVSQLIVKSQVALLWGGKTVWLIQDVLAEYISSSTALNLRNYVNEHPNEVNILAFGYGDIRNAQPITPLANSTFYSGPISTDNAQAGFVDIVKIGAAPPKDHLWRALFKKQPVASLTGEIGRARKREGKKKGRNLTLEGQAKGVVA